MTSTEIVILAAQMGVILGMSPEHILSTVTLRECFIHLATIEAIGGSDSVSEETNFVSSETKETELPDSVSDAEWEAMSGQ